VSASQPSAPARRELVVHDCWNRVGVRGDRSCPELVAHTHCRNCPVYATAAAQLLDGSVSELQVEQATAQFAQPRARRVAGTASVVAFRIGAEWLALPTRLFDEAAEVRPVHLLPHRRGGPGAGLVSVRGDLVPHVSLAGLLEIEAGGPAGGDEANARAGTPRLLILSSPQGRIAITVDEVAGVHRHDEAELRPVPDTLARTLASHTAAMLQRDERTIGCLDPDRVLAALSAALA
jgi:chemotaxis-related protein WspD